MIRIKNLTKDFGRRRGIFDLSFEIEDGEVFGYLGPHHAGKTTTIRQLMGFAYPTKGRCYINGRNCHSKQDEIQKFTGYLPEVSSLPGHMTGTQFLRFAAQMKDIRNMERAFKMAARFDLNTDIKINKMSKEARRKVCIISAFMHDPSVLLLDEPLHDLDFFMQSRLIELILEEKRRGKTIVICSQIFDEVERVCDRIGMIRSGNIINIDDISGIRACREKTYIITFESEQDARHFIKEGFKIKDITGCQVTLQMTGKIHPLLQALNSYPVVGLDTQAGDLEMLFSHFYGGDRND